MTDYPGFAFEVTRTVTGQTGWPGAARRGRITTPHGVIETPAFVFCATRGALRGVLPSQARAEATQIILGNTYHLMLQPGAERVAALGGLQDDGLGRADAHGFGWFPDFLIGPGWG